MNSDASAGRRLTPTTALVAVLAVLAALLGTSVATVSATAGAAVAATTAATPAATTGSLNYGPAPWWQGNCDADQQARLDRCRIAPPRRFLSRHLGVRTATFRRWIPRRDLGPLRLG